jgi:exodeoxyribonuclease V alpha subunit
MSAPYDLLGIRTAWNRFSTDLHDDVQPRFERQLRAIEEGAPALNLSSESVHLAAEIAAFELALSGDERVALILLIVSSLAALEAGSTRFPVTGPQSVEPMRRMLGPLCGDAFGTDGIDRMRNAIEQILTSASAPSVIGTDPNNYRPLLYLSPFVYHQRVFSAEAALGRRLAILLDRQSNPIDDSRLSDLLLKLTTNSALSAGGGLDLSEEQRSAIRCAALAPLTIISGGPGTGKTSIILAILRVLTAAGEDPREIALAAPTGKAAYRISESIRANLRGDPDNPAFEKAWPEPTTVHRLLGYSPRQRRFRHHRGNPLAAKVVIIDEGSMLDLELMSRLLDAMRPDARLVILGDSDQLPSVSAGAVFRDLLTPADNDDAVALTRNCVRLTRNYRTERGSEGGSSIFNFANGINTGERNLFGTGDENRAAAVIRRDSAEQLVFAGVEWLEEVARGAFLERWYLKNIRGDGGIDDPADRIFTATETGFAPAECDALRRVFEKVARSRILCLTRVFDSGAERINTLLHRRVAHDRGVSPDRNQLMVGEPVMISRNDYERELFNGDQGVVLRVRQANHEAVPMVVFQRDDNFVALSIAALAAHLELCYAMTVHKAQGSEFDSVAVIMPDKDLPILTREILYTAVSRARRSVIVIGSKDVIETGLARRIERFSGVRERLVQCLHEAQRG